MSTGKVIIRNVFSNWFGLGFQMLIVLFISPFLVHRLGNAGYGIWIMIVSFVGYFGLVDLGVRTSIVKYCAQFEAGREERKFNEIVNSTLVFYVCIGVLVFLGCLVLGERAHRTAAPLRDKNHRAEQVDRLQRRTILGVIGTKTP